MLSFIQFQERGDESAGFMNYVLNGGRNEITRANTQYNVNINSKGKTVAVAFWNGNNAIAGLSIWY